MATLFVGTSGWSYKEWRTGFYAGVPQKRWLEHYASVFRAVELNGTFYRAARPGTLERWCEATPTSFVFTAKGHRVTTHYRQLKDATGDVVRQRDLLAPLGGRLAAVVWQLPARLKADVARLEAFADALKAWSGTRHAIEFRDASWFVPEVETLLSRHHLANVVSDAPTFPCWDRDTTDLTYIRLHGHERLYRSPYPDAALEVWAARCQKALDAGHAVHVYFDNTDEGVAPFDAQKLCRLIEA
ncbi:MAG TPA: DUF72 domain-containing protein [Geminicoccaceae bacterium]